MSQSRSSSPFHRPDHDADLRSNSSKETAFIARARSNSLIKVFAHGDLYVGCTIPQIVTNTQLWTCLNVAA